MSHLTLQASSSLGMRAKPDSPLFSSPFVPAATLFFVWLATAAPTGARNHTSYSNRVVVEPEMVFLSDAGGCEMLRADKQQMLMDAGMKGGAHVCEVARPHVAYLL